MNRTRLRQERDLESSAAPSQLITKAVTALRKHFMLPLFGNVCDHIVLGRQIVAVTGSTPVSLPLQRTGSLPDAWCPPTHMERLTSQLHSDLHLSLRVRAKRLAKEVR
jgi:hypothetical protein